MKKPTDGGVSFESRERQNAAGSIHSDLLSLIRRIQTSIRFGELAMATAALDDGEVAEGQYVLDDVTPRHAIAIAALNACHAAVGEALRHFLEAEMPGVSPQAARAA
jgi:hypothetical protein